MEKDRRPLPPQAKGWLIALGVLGAVIVILSTVVYHVDSGISIVGYVLGFICILLAAVAMFSNREEP
jgi:hypothetical protein